MYRNIRKVISFLLSCNISEILIVLAAMLPGWDAPSTTVQLLFVNVVTDGLPGFALGKEPVEKGIMDEAPAPKNEGISARGLWQKIGTNVAVFIVITLFGFYLGAFVPGVSAYVSNSHGVGQTVIFLILTYPSILRVFNVRNANSALRVKLSSNKSLSEMVVLALLTTTTIALLPFTQELFGLVHISLSHWMLAIFLSFVSIFVNEMTKLHFSEVEEEEEVI